MSKKFQFSIVTALYNVEEYVEEEILSIINQTIGFKKHVQLILVNDGSTDSSGKICEKYCKKYPNNIIYIEKENGGVSSARNEGLKSATGKYINFLDSDDKLGENVLEKVAHFFNIRNDEIDLVALPIIYFDADEGEHGLNGKFINTRVIDINIETEALQLHCSSTFIKREALKGLKFNADLKYGEDAEIANKVILQKGKYGVVSDCYYFYRKRQGETSAIQNAKNAKENYIPVLENFHKELIRYSLEKKGYVCKYLQNVLMYEVSWKLKQPSVLDTTMDEKQREEFWKIFKGILDYIDDDIIWNMKNFSWNMKRYVFELKNGVSVRKEIYFLKKDNDIVFCYRDRGLAKLSEQKVYFELTNIRKNNLEIKGKFNSIFGDKKFDIYLEKRVQGKIEMYKVTPTKDIYNNIYSLNTLLDEMYCFEVTIPIQEENDIEITCYIQYEDNQYEVPIECLRSSLLPNKYKYMYAISKERILSKNKGKLKIESYRKEIVDKYEEFLQKEIEKENVLTYEEILSIRNEYLETYEVSKNKRIWLISDRVYEADDNGERFFRYLRNKQNDIEYYFVIHEEAKAFGELQQFGKVVGFGTREHKLLTLQADKIISSHANESTYNPFGRVAVAYSGFMDADRVFLQHGITWSDLSDWLCKKNKNIRLFITSARGEYNDILEGNYGYKKDEVVLTGFPRYDTLVNEARNEILYVPTWDNRFIKLVDGETIYNDKFKESLLFHRMNQFLNNSRMLEALDEYGYVLKFRPHPNLMIQIGDFNISEKIEIVEGDTSYQEMFRTGSLLITDYSSVQFDFAYMKKPVLYYQCTPYHHSSSYFDVEAMGFGEVVTEQEKAIDLLISYIKEGCKMKEVYKKRVDNFFEYTDQNNCQRVYDAILNLDNKTI